MLLNETYVTKWGKTCLTILHDWCGPKYFKCNIVVSASETSVLIKLSEIDL